MKDKIEMCKKCEKIIDETLRKIDVSDDVFIMIEKFIINNYEILKEEKEYQILVIKYILLQERKKQNERY